MAKRGRKKKQQSAEPASTEPRQRGRKSQYDAETKAAILKACADARKAGMTWGDALDASRAAGFRRHASVPDEDGERFRPGADSP